MISDYTRLFYHGAGRGSFEGWYFKHRSGDQVFAAIPGVAADRNGRKSAFVQCIYNGGSVCEDYPFDAFEADAQRLYVRVGESVFSEYGARIRLDRVSADIAYAPFGRMKRSLYAPSMMGPFSYCGFLECYHDVLSDGHAIAGRAVIEGQTIDLTGGMGYVEKDWGSSFPKSWMWLECSDFDTDARLMAALADVPFGRLSFRGVLCSLKFNGRIMRLATYYGARASVRAGADCTGLRIRQGAWEIGAEICPGKGFALYAPVGGNMSREIHEHPACKMTLRVKRLGKTVLSTEGKNAGFEWVK